MEREPGGYRIIRTMQKSCPAGKSAFAFELPPHKSPYAYSDSVPLLPGSVAEKLNLVEDFDLSALLRSEKPFDNNLRDLIYIRPAVFTKPVN